MSDPEEQVPCTGTAILGQSTEIAPEPREMPKYAGARPVS